MIAIAESDRVRAATPPALNERIDQEIANSIRFFALQPKSVISRRIAELDEEWSIERWLQVNASCLAMTGLVLGVVESRKWLMLTGTVLGFLLLHGTRGWCPPLPLLRRMGLRTRKEIDREKYALKIIRGDFGDIPKEYPLETLIHALRL
jgi:hypothetical protein